MFNINMIHGNLYTGHDVSQGVSMSIILSCVTFWFGFCLRSIVNL